MQRAQPKQKTLVVDVDGTLTNGEYPYTDCTPRTDVISKVNECYEAGWKILLLTARGQNTYEGDVQKCDQMYRTLTTEWLVRHGVKFHELSFRKPAAVYYIDDKSLTPEVFLKCEL